MQAWCFSRYKGTCCKCRNQFWSVFLCLIAVSFFLNFWDHGTATLNRLDFHSELGYEILEEDSWVFKVTLGSLLYFWEDLLFLLFLYSISRQNSCSCLLEMKTLIIKLSIPIFLGFDLLCYIYIRNFNVSILIIQSTEWSLCSVKFVLSWCWSALLVLALIHFEAGFAQVVCMFIRTLKS